MATPRARSKGLFLLRCLRRLHGNAARTEQGEPLVLAVLPALLRTLRARNLQAVTLRQALPDLAANDWVDLPSQITEQLGAMGQPDPADVLSQPALRCVVRSADDESRMGYAPWLPVALLRELAWPQERGRFPLSYHLFHGIIERD